MAINTGNLDKWIGECIRDDRNFITKDADEEVEFAKEVILETIQKLKGRII